MIQLSQPCSLAQKPSAAGVGIALSFRNRPKEKKDIITTMAFSSQSLPNRAFNLCTTIVILLLGQTHQTDIQVWYSFGLNEINLNHLSCFGVQAIACRYVLQPKVVLTILRYLCQEFQACTSSSLLPNYSKMDQN